MPDPVRLLLDHFPDLTRLPGSIPELRKLILQRAVRGELTADWRQSHPDTEPASVLLEKIKAEKARLVKAGKIKKQQPLPEIREDEVPFELPEGWVWTRLGVVTFNYGQKNPEKTFNYIDVSGVDNKRFRINKTQVLSPEEAPSRARKIVDDNTLIFSTVRPYLLNCAILRNDDCTEYIASTAFAVMKMKPGIIDYLFYYLRSDTFIRFLEEEMIGVAYPAISEGAFFLGMIPLPPLAEQQEIVARVERLLGLCDQLETAQKAEEAVRVRTRRASLAALDGGETARAWPLVHDCFGTLIRTPDDVRELRKSILQLAVRGRLTEDWRRYHPDTEPASVLLEKIKAEKARLVKAGKIKKQQPLPEIGEDEVPFEVPEGWVWCRLINVFDVRDGTHDTPKYVKDGFPLVTSKNISSGYLDLNNVNYISEADHLEISKRSKVDNGDVLFAMIGSIGNPVIVDSKIEFSIKNVALFKKYKANLCNTFYLRLFLIIESEEMKIRSLGGVQSFVSLNFLRSYLFPLPPLTEQQEIVACVERLMGMCDRLEAGLADTGETGARVWRALGAG